MTMQDWSQRLNRFLEFNEHDDPPRHRPGDA